MSDERDAVQRSRLTLEYDGGAFAGWARQPGKRTVQAELERALGVVLRAPVFTVLLAVLALAATAWPVSRIGSEFMPALNEGTLRYMPVTLPGLSFWPRRPGRLHGEAQAGIYRHLRCLVTFET